MSNVYVKYCEIKKKKHLENNNQIDCLFFITC